MRLYPDSKSEVTDELLFGTTVISFDESYAGFLFCKTDYGYSGYVDVSDLSAKTHKGERYVVTSSFCDVYDIPEYRFALGCLYGKPWFDRMYSLAEQAADFGAEDLRLAIENAARVLEWYDDLREVVPNGYHKR